MWSTLLVVFMAGASAQANADYEKAIRADLERRSPQALAAFVAGSEAREANLPDVARGQFSRVLELEPDFGPAHRRLASVLLQQGKKTEALHHARRAVELEPIAASHLVAATALLEPPTPDNGGARRELDQALKLDPTDLQANYLRAVVSLRENDLHGARARLAAVRQVEPDGLIAHHLTALVEAAAGNPLDALDAAKRAQEKGDSPALAEAIERAAGSELWLERAIRYGPQALVGWAVALGTLFVLGFTLSKVQLAMLARRSRAGGTDGAISPAEKALLWLYQAVILATMVFFYLSIPVCVVLVFLTGGGIIYGFFAIGRIPIKLAAVIGIATLLSLYALVRGLFARASDDDPGQLLSPDEQPELYRFVREVAERLGTRPVEGIYLTPGSEVAVTERGGFFRSLFGRGRRSLIIGLAALDGMTQQQLRAILAHEYGHFINGDLKIGTLTHHVYLSLVHMLQGMASVGRLAYGNLAYWMLRLFLRMYTMVTHGSGRMREVLADRAAARLYGGKAFADGLVHVIRKGALFDSACTKLLRDYVKPDGTMGNVYALVGAPHEQLDLAEVEASAKESLDRSGSAYDSHPPPAQRIAWTQHYPGTVFDSAPVDASALVRGRDGLAEQMAKEIDVRIRVFVAQVEAAQATEAA